MDDDDDDGVVQKSQRGYDEMLEESYGACYELLFLFLFLIKGKN